MDRADRTCYARCTDGQAARLAATATERVSESARRPGRCVLDHNGLHRRRSRRLDPGYLAVHRDRRVVAHRGNLRGHRRCHLGILVCEWAIRLARRLTVPTALDPHEKDQLLAERWPL